MIIRTLVPAAVRCRSCGWHAAASGTTGQDVAWLKEAAREHQAATGHVVDVELGQRLTFAADLAQAAL